MATSAYPTYRAIGRPVTFKGLKGQYILLAAAALIADFLFFILMYCGGMPTGVNIGLTFGLGAAALAIIRRLSRRFGQFGLTKYLAAKSLPPHLRYASRQIFLHAASHKNKDLPILEVSNSFIISGRGDIAAAYNLILPELHSLSPGEFEANGQFWVKAIASFSPDTILHKQDYFIGTTWHDDFKNKEDSSLLTHSSARHFNGYPYREHRAYLFITRTTGSSRRATSVFSALFRRTHVPASILDPARVQEFEEECRQFEHILREGKFVDIRRLSDEELTGTEHQVGLIEQYTLLTSDPTKPQLCDVRLQDGIQVGDKQVVIYTVADAEQLPAQCSSHTPDNRYSTEKTALYMGFSAHVGPLLDEDHICNQFLLIGRPQAHLTRLDTRRRRLKALSTQDRENAVAHDAIESYLTEAATDGKRPVKMHANIIAWTSRPDRLTLVKNKVATAMAKMGIVPKIETIGAPQIWLAGIPGNAGDLPINDTWYTFVEQAICFFIMDTYGRSTPGPSGLRFGERQQGTPLEVDLSDGPLSKDWIKNLNKLIISPSGGGKTFLVLHLVHSYHQQGAHLLIIDIGDSYKRLCQLLGGYYLAYTQESPIQFNPFWLAEGDTPDIEKKEFILALLLALWKKSNEVYVRSEYIVLSNMVQGFYDHRTENMDIFPCFDSFYEYLNEVFAPRLAKEGVRDQHFDMDNFLYVLRPYYKGGEYDYLLNAREQLDLLHQRLVIFELDAIKDHAILFPVVTIIIMDAFISKMRRLKGIRKVMLVDEAWKPLANDIMGEFLKYSLKTVRKFNGEAIIVTQDIEDLISSPVVKNAIINNTDCKILPDQSNLGNRFDQLRELLDLSDKDKALVLSLNKANRPGKKYKEVFISLGHNHSRVYRLEVSLEEYLVFTSKQQEKMKVDQYAKLHGSLWKGIMALAADIRSGTVQLLLAFLFSALFILLPNGRASAQLLDLIDAAVKKALVTADLAVQRLQTQTLVLQNIQKNMENTMQDSWLSDITGWVQQQENLYKDYYQQLWQVKTVFTSYSKVKELIHRQTEVLKQYAQAQTVLRQDPHFSPQERAYLSNVYTGLLSQTGRNIQQLSLVIGNFLTQMDDASRLKIIDETAGRMDHDYSTLRNIQQQSALLSLQRSKDTHEILFIQQLYGIQ